MHQQILGANFTLPNTVWAHGLSCASAAVKIGSLGAHFLNSSIVFTVMMDFCNTYPLHPDTQPTVKSAGRVTGQEKNNIFQFSPSSRTHRSPHYTSHRIPNRHSCMIQFILRCGAVLLLAGVRSALALVLVD